MAEIARSWLPAKQPGRIDAASDAQVAQGLAVRQCVDHPFRLAAATRPGLRVILGIAVLGAPDRLVALSGFARFTRFTGFYRQQGLDRQAYVLRNGEDLFPRFPDFLLLACLDLLVNIKLKAFQFAEIVVRQVDRCHWSGSFI